MEFGISRHDLSLFLMFTNLQIHHTLMPFPLSQMKSRLFPPNNSYSSCRLLKWPLDLFPNNLEIELVSKSIYSLQIFLLKHFGNFLKNKLGKQLNCETCRNSLIINSSNARLRQSEVRGTKMNSKHISLIYTLVTFAIENANTFRTNLHV